jgi:hypothetical protein
VARGVRRAAAPAHAAGSRAAPPHAPRLRRRAAPTPAPRPRRSPAPSLRPAAGQLTAARELTARLQGPAGQARSYLAAPAHMLVVLHDRCCDWGAAHAVLEGLSATGVRPDGHILGALTCALWGCGAAAGCLLALRVFEEACKLGVFK